MRESGASALSNRAGLVALRAAAILIVVTGLNDMLAGALPRYEPLYLYLAAVAVVTWLDGVLLGLLSAIAASAFYVLLFLRPVRFELTHLIPMGWAVGVVVVIALLRLVLRVLRRQAAQPARASHQEPGELPMIEASVLPPSDDVLGAIEQLRRELSEDAAKARERERMLKQELRDARNATAHAQELERAARLTAAAEAERIVAGANRAIEDLSLRMGELEQSVRTQAESRYGQLEADVRRERGRADTAIQTLAQVQAALESEGSETRRTAQRLAAREAELGEARADQERLLARVGELERSLRDSAVANAKRIADLESVVRDTKGARADRDRLAARVVELEAASHRAEQENAARIAKLEEALRDAAGALAERDRISAQVTGLEGELQRAKGERQATASRLHEVEAASAERDRLAERVTELEELLRRGVDEQAAAGQRMRELESAAADRERLAIRIHELEEALSQAAIERSELTAAASVSHEELERLAARAADAEAELKRARENVSGISERLRGLEAAAEDRQQLTVQLAEVREALAHAEVERNEWAAAAAARAAERQQLARRVEELEAALGSAETSRSAIESGLNEERKQFAERIAAMEQAVAAAEASRAAADARREAGRQQLQQRVDELQQALAAAEAAREELVAAGTRGDEQRQQLAARVADLEQALARAQTGQEISAAAAEQARAARESFAQRVQQLEDALKRSVREHTVAATRIRDLEAAARERVGPADKSAELEAARARIAELEAASRDAEKEFDAKLAKIVAHLAEDHENDLGTAMMEKEGARAEARNYSMRLAAVQQKLDEERELSKQLMIETRAAFQAEVDSLRARVAELESSGTLPPARPRILVAHPDAELREAARGSLERAGFEVTTAGDGLEGLRVAIALLPDVVIADAVMPKMDGRELCQLLKSQEKTAHIKVVLLTRGNAEPAPADTSLAPDDILRKPVPFDVLRMSLTTLLGARTVS